MFSNLNWTNVVILLLLALFIFGDKLPQIISDGFRLLRQFQRMAQNATSDINRELGTDLQLADLHPKTFVRKHLLSEADQEALLRPLRSVSDDVVRQTRGVQDELRQAGRRAERAAREARRPLTRDQAAGRAATGSIDQGQGVNDQGQGVNDQGRGVGDQGRGPVPDPAPADPAPAPAPRPSFDDIT